MVLMSEIETMGYVTLTVEFDLDTVADPEGGQGAMPPPNLWQFFDVPSIA